MPRRLPILLAAGALLCAGLAAAVGTAIMLTDGRLTGGGLTRVEVQQRLLTLGVPVERLDRAALDRIAEDVAARAGLAAPAGARNSPAWPLQHDYAGQDGVLMVVSISSVHAFVTLSKRPGDAHDHAALVRQLTEAFAPLGFAPSQD